VLAFVAPKIVGGQSAPSPIGELGLNRMTEALTLDRVTLKTIDQDVLISGYLKSSVGAGFPP
jgi:diaminohydroxyphosphoribosylaminopyrimidine deaminase / 5-amino-6-(5-phosphoribosylamino)uracil reductase